MKDKKYNPINCNLYDELEILAMRKQRTSILFIDNETQVELEDALIKNLYSREKIEYMVLESGVEIRLDQLIEVDGKVYHQD